MTPQFFADPEAFTPRRPGSTWSSVNVARVAELSAQGRMRAAVPAAVVRNTATWWVVSAKRAETRDRRLAQLVDDSAHGRRSAHLSGP